MITIQMDARPNLLELLREFQSGSLYKISRFKNTMSSLTGVTRLKENKALKEAAGLVFAGIPEKTGARKKVNKPLKIFFTIRSN